MTLTKENFREEVLESTNPVLVEFGAAWCGASHIVAPIIEEMSVIFKGQIKIVKMNVDNNEQVFKEHGIRNLPTFLFFKNGQVVDHIIGVFPKEALKIKLNALVDARNIDSQVSQGE